MFTIDAVHGVNWYAISYLVSNVFTFALLLYLGWRKGYSLLSWIPILVTGALFFLIGTKLFALRGEQWTSLFREGMLPATGNKSAIGGMLFAILGIELSRSWLRVREYVLDTYVLVVPVGLAIQKMGCLMTGCCFGTPTSLPWGIRYAQGTSVHYHHWITNGIHSAEAWSLPVHPLPLYESLCYLLIFGALLLLGPYLKKRGSRFLLAITLLALSRFTLEFLRDPAATVALGQELAGLKAMQWLMLLTGIIAGLLFLRKIKQTSRARAQVRETKESIWRNFTLISILSIGIWGIHKGFSPVEVLVLNLKLLPALFIFGLQAWIRFTVPRFRLAGVFLLILPVLFMAQSLPKQEGTWKHYHSFGAGGTFGTFSQEALYNEHEGGCGTTFSRNYYDHTFGTATLNYEYIKQSGYITFVYGGSLFGGIDTQQEVDFPGSKRYYSLGILPYLDYNARWVGGGVGASLGYQNFVPSSPFDERTISTGIRTFPFLPYVRLRVGPYDIFDMEYKFQDAFPSMSPVPSHLLSLGSGFGIKNGSGLRVGVAPPYESFFVSAKVLVSERYMIQAKYINWDGNFFSFGLSYRIPAEVKSPGASHTQ